MRVDFYWFNVDGPVGFHHGVAILAQELEEAGHPVRLRHVDPRVGLAWEPDQLARETATSGADVAALSFTTAHEPHARALVEALRRHAPTVRVVVGGVHPTLAPDDVFAWPGVAALGRGECDGALAAFVDGWANGDPAPKVPGFWVKGPDGDLRSPLGPPPTLAGPAQLHPDMDVRGFVQANRGMGNLCVTRGCPHRCSYCHNEALLGCYAESLGVTPARVPYCRRRSVDDTLAEAHRLVERAGAALRVLNFDDDLVVHDRRWFEAVARRLKAEIGLPYVVTCTVSRMTEDLAALLAETGCLLVRFGVESTSPRLNRELLNRRFDAERMQRAFATLRRHGVNSRAYLLMGIPTESEAELLGSFAACGAAQVDTVRPSYLQPYPGTALHDEAVRRGLLRTDVDIASYCDASPLVWPSDRALLLDKAMTLAPWLLNAALPFPDVAARYQALVGDVLGWDRAEWERPGTAERLRRTTLELDREHRAVGAPHYLAPFPDRRDLVFLVRPDRRAPFPNIDDAWPPDAPWKDAPLP